MFTANNRSIKSKTVTKVYKSPLKPCRKRRLREKKETLLTDCEKKHCECVI